MVHLIFTKYNLNERVEIRTSGAFRSGTIYEIKVSITDGGIDAVYFVRLDRAVGVVGVTWAAGPASSIRLPNL